MMSKGGASGSSMQQYVVQRIAVICEVCLV